MEFVDILGYTPSLCCLVHVVVVRVVYIIGFIVMMLFPWWPPPCGVGRIAMLAYESYIIFLMPL